MTCLSNYILLLLPVLFLGSCATRQRMVNYDVSYVYHPEKTMVKRKILNKPDSLEIFLSYSHPVEFDQLSREEFTDNYKFIYKITHDHYSAEFLLSDCILLQPG